MNNNTSPSASENHQVSNQNNLVQTDTDNHSQAITFVAGTEQQSHGVPYTTTRPLQLGEYHYRGIFPGRMSCGDLCVILSAHLVRLPTRKGSTWHFYLSIAPTNFDLTPIKLSRLLDEH